MHNTAIANDIDPQFSYNIHLTSEQKTEAKAKQFVKQMDEYKKEFGDIYINEFRHEDIVSYEFIALDPATREELSLFEFDVRDHDEDAVAFIDAINRHTRPLSYSELKPVLALNPGHPEEKHLHIQVVVQTEARGNTLFSSHVEDVVVSFAKDGIGQWQNTACEFVDERAITKLAGRSDFYSPTVPETASKIEDPSLIKSMFATLEGIDKTYSVIKAPIIGQHAADSLKDDPVFMLSVVSDYPDSVSEHDLSDTDHHSFKATTADIKTYLTAKAKFFTSDPTPAVTKKPFLKH